MRGIAVDRLIPVMLKVALVPRVHFWQPKLGQAHQVHFLVAKNGPPMSKRGPFLATESGPGWPVLVAKSGPGEPSVGWTQSWIPNSAEYSLQQFAVMRSMNK